MIERKIIRFLYTLKSPDDNYQFDVICPMKDAASPGIFTPLRQSKLACVFSVDVNINK